MATDKTIMCRDCGTAFIFTAGEQDFYSAKGFTNEPVRCRDCRQNRKRSSDDGSSTVYSTRSYSTDEGGERPRREMFSATCSSCGNEARVPFAPREDKPVYCSDCFETQRGKTSRTQRW